MAADVKIALLLGLMFLFAGAFVITGVPRSDNAKDDNGLSAVMVSGPPGIRPETLPEDFPPDPIRIQIPNRPRFPPDNVEPTRGTSGTIAPGEIEKNTEPMEPALPEVRYVVRRGDTLADIAKRFYGPEQGNKRANVMRIFEANRRALDSPDEIYAGQTLIIPSPRAAKPADGKNESIFPDSMFENVESIGRGHLYADKRKTQ